MSENGKARLHVDSLKQSMVAVHHQTDAEATASQPGHGWAFGITNSGLLAITQGSDLRSSGNQAITVEANSSTSGSKKQISLKGNVIIEGNLMVLGNTTHTSIESETVRIGDNMIQLNANLTETAGFAANSDFGFWAQATVSNTVLHTGIAWDHDQSTFTTFRTSVNP